MKFTFNPALLIVRVLLSTKNTISPLTSTFHVTQTWSDSIFLNFLMKTQGFFGFLCVAYLVFNGNIASCDDSIMNIIEVEHCGVEGIILLHYDAMTFLLFLLFVVTAIMGNAIYYFKGARGEINYKIWLATEQAIRKQPLKAGFDLVTGLTIVVGLGLLYYLYPCSSSIISPTFSTSVSTTESLVQNEFMAKPVNTNLTTNSSLTDPVLKQSLKSCFHDYKKGVYPHLLNDVQRELDTWEPRHLYRFEKFNGQLHYSDVYESKDVRFTVYKTSLKCDFPVPSYQVAWEVNSPLAYESRDYMLKLSNCWMNHDSLHKLANNAAFHGNSKKLYLMQSYLEGRRSLELGVLQSLDTRLPDIKLGQMSNQELIDACLKAENILFYGLDDVTKVIPPRMEFMLSNEHPELVTKILSSKPRE